VIRGIFYKRWLKADSVAAVGHISRLFALIANKRHNSDDPRLLCRRFLVEHITFTLFQHLRPLKNQW